MGDINILPSCLRDLRVSGLIHTATLLNFKGYASRLPLSVSSD